MRRLVGVSAVFFLALAGAAAPANAPHNRITTSGIGALRLGMGNAAAKRALRQVRAGALRSCEDTRLHGGLLYRQCSYYRGYGEDSYSIGFLGPRRAPKRLRVARIVTFVQRDRTSRGAHVGMGLRPIYKMYGRVMRCDQTIYIGKPIAYTPCRLGAETKPHVVLLFSASGNDGPWIINRIIVQEPGLRIPVIQ
jgi:hypothetical protein